MKKLMFLISLVLIASFMLTACGPTATPAPATQPPATQPPATQPPTKAPTATSEPAGTLRIWADDTRTPILQGMADAFLAEYNVQLVVEDMGVVQDIRSQAIIAIPAGEGPDIYLGVHDWLGALIASGLAAPIDIGDKTAEFVPSTLEAFTYTDGKLYGMPYASENLGFFYNTDLVQTVPTTWDGVLEVARTLKAEGKIDYATAISSGPLYNAFPIQTAFGGYVFGKDANGAWNPQDVGIDSAGEIAAVAWMRAAVEEGLMPNTFDYETAHSLFETGKIPFLMAGPWALDRIRASGVPYAVATSFPGNGVPFSGVQGFFVNPYSENVLLAQAFLTEYIATENVMQQLADTGNRPSAFKSVLEKTTDPDLKAMGLAGVNAIPMPNIPEMGSVWSAADNGITLGVTGQQTPEDAMTDAANQIRTLIAGALAGMVNLPGTWQDQAGCGATWDPACEATGMVQGADGLYTLTVNLKAGSYEYKVALDGSWGVNYGSDGALNGPNYTMTLAADSTVTFTYDPNTHLVTTK
jgi:maltose/maltodextrin transport system substrate-binding protein/arabinogalactan oligomer/maltooligosaccharide transport system substrate-binding protein